MFSCWPHVDIIRVIFFLDQQSAVSLLKSLAQSWDAPVFTAASTCTWTGSMVLYAWYPCGIDILPYTWHIDIVALTYCMPANLKKSNRFTERLDWACRLLFPRWLTVGYQHWGIHDQELRWRHTHLPHDQRQIPLHWKNSAAFGGMTN